MSEYARHTSVPADRTRVEIERLLARYGADGFGYVTDLNRAMLTFRLDQRMVRLTVPLPVLADFKYWPKRRGEYYRRERTNRQQQEACDQAIRARWRSVRLIIQAKLEAIQDGVSTIEREFMADLVLPTGKTLGDTIAPQMEAVLGQGWMPQLTAHEQG